MNPPKLVLPNSYAARGVPLPMRADARKTVNVIHHHVMEPAAKMSAVGMSPWTNPFRVYEALSQSGDRTPITTAGLGPMLAASGRWLPAPIVDFQRLLLGSISEYLYDNNGVVSSAVDMIANYSAPVVPRAATDDPDLNEVYDDYFSTWAKIADYSGRFDFWKLQEIACKAVDKHGDQGFIATAENGFPQLQTVESWQIGALKVPTMAYRIIDGVVLDNKGAVLGYVIQTMDNIAIIPVNQLKLIYDPDAFHRYRGYSAIRRGSNDVRDHGDIKGFEKIAAKIHAALAAIIEGGPMVEDDWGDDGRRGAGNGGGGGNEFQDGTGNGTDTKHEKRVAKADLLGGDIPVLPSGQKLTLLKNDRGGASTIDFMEALEGAFISGLGMPPAFFSDKRLTGPNVRAVIGKAQRKFNRRQEMLAGLVEWTWARVMADAINKRAVPASPMFGKITFQYPSKLVIDLGDQATNDRDDVQAGQMTRRERFGNRALDWQRETDQVGREQNYIFEKAQAIADQYKLPLEIVLQGYGYLPPKAPPGAGGDGGGNAGPSPDASR